MTSKHFNWKNNIRYINNTNALNVRNISILKSYQHQVNVQTLSGTYKTFFLYIDARKIFYHLQDILSGKNILSR